ncbi:hypothetical protein [Chitinimonas sp.]|uniref:hypothetical protein n=1 Tax=Chitinimonas sp. TaxID=1934313 RepID=UPI0035B0DD09
MAEVPVTQELLAKAFGVLKHGEILVGGQALAFWAAHYRVSLDSLAFTGAISKDVDVLGDRESAIAIANATQGTVELVDHTHALTALIGTVKVRLSGDDYAIIDVLHRLLQTNRAELQAIRERALDVEVAGVAMRVMHPLDVLSSRIANIRWREEKQDDQGVAQLRLAILMAAAYLYDIASFDQELAMYLVEQTVKICKASEAAWVAKHFDVTYLPAIPQDAIENSNFQEKRLPRIRQELG